MLIPRHEVLAHIEMKTRRAQKHFDELQRELDAWLKLPPYSVGFYTDFDKVLEVWHVYMKVTPEAIPMALGDFICCLRSALDQLAWGLAHLDVKRVFSKREERNISFLVFTEKNPTYDDRRKLFPPAVADVFDGLQPYNRGNAFADDPLWQLNELWILDKHKLIPINSSSLQVRFPMWGWENYVRHLDYGIEVHFPLSRAWMSPVNLDPAITMEILFGEYMGSFEVSLVRLKEINEFVAKDVIPRFASFFS